MQSNPKDFIVPKIMKNEGMRTKQKYEFLKPSLHSIYFSRSEDGPVCGVYNLTEEQVGLLLPRVKNNPKISYEVLLKDMLGVMYADEGKSLNTML